MAFVCAWIPGTASMLPRAAKVAGIRQLAALTSCPLKLTFYDDF
jgi:hypothetical protein